MLFDLDLDGSYVVGAEVVESGHLVLIVTENGYGKQTVIDEYRKTHRGSKGVKALNVTEKNGTMVSLKCLHPEAKLDLMIMTDSGILIKLPLEQVSTLKRATQGVRLINLKGEQKVATVALVEKEEEQEIDEISETEDNVSNSSDTVVSGISEVVSENEKTE